MRHLGTLAGLCLAAACGGVEPAADTGQGTGPGPQTSLMIEIRSREGAPPSRYTLTCDPAGGTLPDAGGACARLAAGPDPFAPVPPDVVCTQIYGGPEIATVRGVWRGQQVAATFNRTNGCEIARYRRLIQLLGLS